MSVKKMASLMITTALAMTLDYAGMAMAQEQPPALTESQIVAQLAQQGYTDVHDVDFKDGVWTARARSGDGSRVKLRVDPTTGVAYPNKQVSRINEKDIRAILSSQGYTHIHDVDYDHGVWTAKARNNAGTRVSLQLDGDSGRIIGTN
ncbi:MAG TPA: PepSY domain-containing protein [Dyella sp.]|uniref:PepSY domain-containing protein n=1 Tax=Dyella sp. TaxID=1869338 RepID=UPI002C738EB7|nr:PepSY domain-containing protein [Dyella sp.]HUB90982.1 PepSY domain-containing protein [Dyella sp.]